MTVHSQQTTKQLSITSIKGGKLVLASIIYCPPSNGNDPNCIINLMYNAIYNNSNLAVQMKFMKIHTIEGLNDVSLS